MENNNVLVCPRNKIIQDITSDRYKFYNSMYGQSPVWSDELNAWMVFDFKMIKEFLNDKRLYANRKGDFIKKLGLSEENETFLSTFYSRWLMYMDNPNHSELRKKIQLPLNKLNKSIFPAVKDFAAEIIQNLGTSRTIDIAEEIAEPFVTKVMSDLLGINEAEYTLLLKEANSAIDFLWKPQPTEQETLETIHSIQKTHDIISNIILEERHKKDRLIHLMVENTKLDEESMDLIINIAIDGHEPLVSSVKTYILVYLEDILDRELNLEDISLKNLIEKSLRLEAPFPYCARNASEEIQIGNEVIGKGQRIIFFISAGNRDHKEFSGHQLKENPAKNLTFGVGSHYCLGAIITRRSIEELALALEEKMKYVKDVEILNLKWTDTFGFRTLTEFNVLFKDAEL